MSTQVNYTKHYDGEMKGMIIADENNITRAILLAELSLLEEAAEYGLGDSDPAELFTITAAKLVDRELNWTGVPKAAF